MGEGGARGRRGAEDSIDIVVVVCVMHVNSESVDRCGEDEAIKVV